LGVQGKMAYFATDLIFALKGKSEGDKVTFDVIRGGKRQSAEVVLRADCNFKNSSEISKLWRALGSDTYEGADGNLYWSVTAENCRFGFFQTLGRSFAYSFKTMGTIFRVLGELLTGSLGLNAMGGPVTTIRQTGAIAVQGFQSFLQVAAYIGVNLAVFNLLPIPALDGSKVIFCLIEWIFRKPVPRKVEAIIHAIGFVLIIGFAILVDIMQFARC
ncbi:MAG: site-2 protease family protein, partial [Clostridia bacterium]|nr:site-2 protease family protein [Clostridia bacterium]